METRIINLQDIRRQLIANIYNTLTDKGYNPEEGVDIADILGYTPELMVSGNYSLNYGNDDYTYLFSVRYIQFLGDAEFWVYNINPNGEHPAEDVSDKDFLIEGLAQIEDLVNELDLNINN